MKRNMLIKVLLMFCLCVLFIAVPQRFHAEEEFHSKIRVGYLKNCGVITDEFAETEKGYGYEYFAEIAKYTGWEYEYIVCEWSEGLEKLEKGEIDILSPLQKSEARSLQFDFPDEEMGLEYTALYVPINNQKIYYNNPQSLDGLRIGTEPNSFFNSKMDEYCRENGITIQYVYTDVSNFWLGLQNGEFDAVLSGSTLELEDTAVVAKISIDPYYCATTKGNKKILDGINSAVNNILMNDIYFEAELYAKYYASKPINMPAFTSEEVEFIKNSGTIAVVCDPYWSPITYADEADGKYHGVSVDVLKKIGEISGLSFQIKPVKDYDESKELVANGQAQLILPHTEPASELGVTYSDGFFDIPTMLIGRNSIDLNSKLRVGIANMQTQPARQFMDKFNSFEFVDYKNTKELLEALQTGKESYAFVNSYVYDDIVRGENGGDYVGINTDITYPLRLGISNSCDPILISIINKSISRIQPEQISSTVFSNTVNRAYKMSFSRMLDENIYAVILFIMAFFGILLSIIIFSSHKNQQNLKKAAYQDILTGVSTLTKFELDAVKLTQFARPGEYILVSIDIDNFKYVNDSCGYEAGNELLVQMTRIFQEHNELYELISRMNADHFLFLIKTDNIENYKHMLLDVLDNISHHNGVLSENYNLIFGAGIYCVMDIYNEFGSWVDKANIARKAIKGGHKNSISEYTEEMDKTMNQEKEITLYMNQALSEEQFQVYFQPKYNLISEKMIGAEALVRWQHPVKGLLSPAEFIPLFEKNGFIQQLDYYMFKKVCSFLNLWHNNGLKIVPISVNLSRVHLRNPHLAEELKEITESYHIPPNFIETELTESIVFDNSEVLVNTMSKLKAAGFDISIDDFGSGYSSLNLLIDLPADVLKLDKGFLNRMTDVGKSQMVISKVVEMAKFLNLCTVAEGVETKEQAKLLKEMGCDVAQGYYYARPMSADEFKKLLPSNQSFVENA